MTFRSTQARWLLHGSMNDAPHAASISTCIQSSILTDRQTSRRILRFALMLAAGLGNWLPPTHAAVVDVIVYGSTPGGVCAAVAAAREGAEVVLLEPGKHVGGVNTGGLCFSDSNQTARATLRGLFEEWHQRIERDYQKRGVTLPYKVEAKDQSFWTYEPHVAARVTNAMLDEAQVRVLTGTPLEKVEKNGPKIVRILAGGKSFEAHTLVDASYEGDLMAASGVSWTIGREGRAAFGESMAGRQYPKPKLAISGLDNKDQSLPLITTSQAGDDTQGDDNVMVYSFRLCLTKTPSNRISFPEPAHYEPARFEVIRRYFAIEKRPVLFWDLYPLPGSKFDANNGIAKPFSMGLVGAGKGWCAADPAERARIWEEHRQYTLELYRFLTIDPAVPEKLRRELAQYGLCRDEFTGDGHWSPQLYVREGRRMQGMHVISQTDILKTRNKEDSIAITSFPVDSHDCRRIGTRDMVLAEGTIMPVHMPGAKHGWPSQIPYRSITPKPDECSNLLVPVALSSTHVAYSAIRVEPTWMTIGQSAGVAAALAAKQKQTVQQISYQDLRARLMAQGVVLDLPGKQTPAKPETRYLEQVKPDVLRWLESVRCKDGGWGRWKYHAAMERPYGLQSSGIALRILAMFNELEKIDQKRKLEAITFFQSCQDPKDGLFKDPLETDACHEGSHTWEQIWGQRNGATQRALELLEAGPQHPYAKAQFADLSQVDGRAWTLEGLKWDNPWKDAESWSRAIKAHLATLPAERRNDREPVIASAVAAIESEILDPHSGTPSRRMSKPEPSIAMAGLFKMMSGYLAVGRKVPFAQQGIDSTLALQHDNGEFGLRNNMCLNWDALWILRELDRQLNGTHRHAEIVTAGNRTARMLLRDYRKPDGAFAFSGGMCTSNHHSIRLCPKPLPISDVMGTVMALNCLGYADEWNHGTPNTAQPVPKHKDANIIPF